MTDTIRRRPDGSIDTGYYAARSRVRRSEAALDLGAAAARKTRRPLFGLAALLALLPFLGGTG